MAVYRFRVTFEDYDEVSRDIDVKSNQTFQDLHMAIHQSINYNPDYSSSFYVSNDQWTKGEEIAYKPTQRKIDRGIRLMENTKLSGFIDDPHQKFYYTSNFDRPFDFHVELVKILDDAPGVAYPVTAKTVGEAPKQFGNVYNPTVIPPTSEEFDFLNEMEYTPEDTEDFSEVREDGAVADEHEEESGEEDEFGNEFSDDEDEFSSGKRGHDDDY
ncbi:hypothetical protein GCM10027037_35410 [Mucilaginibacter koreensis]